MIKSFENGSRAGFTHKEAMELEKTGCVADPNDLSAYYVTGAYLTEEQKTWDDGDLRKNEEFSLSGIYWWGDDSVYICDISDLDEEIEAYDDLRELISLGWTPESFDKDFEAYEGADWDKSQKEEYRRIFTQAWEDAQEEMKEAQEKQEKKPTLTKEHWIEVAKRMTAEYAKTHKGRNDIERKCIRDGYIILKGKEVSKNSLDEGSYIFALSKNTSGSGKNLVPVCKA